jgi:hypothetical protein
MNFGLLPTGELFAGHLRLRDRQRLDSLAESRFNEFPVAKFDTGWFVQVGPHPGPGSDFYAEVHDAITKWLIDHDFSAVFKSIVGRARSAGLVFLRIHADAEPTPGLQVFDW